MTERARVRFFASLLLLVALLIVSGGAWAAEATTLDPREAYLSALKALDSKQLDRFDELADQLQDYPLYPYLQIARVSTGLKNAKPTAVRKLLEDYPSMPPSYRLRRSWLRELARRERWEAFLTDYRPQRDMELRCQHALATLRVLGSVGYEPDLWLVGRSQPDACDPVFTHWRQRGLLTADRYFERAVLAAKAGESTFAGFLGRRLSGPRQGEVKRWAALQSNPGRNLAAASRWSDSPPHRQMVLSTLDRIKSRNNTLALSAWPTLREHYSFSADQVAEVDRNLVLFYATDYPLDAQRRLTALTLQDPQIVEWRARVAIKEGDWSSLLAALDNLPAELRDRDRWQYWRARAMAESGSGSEAMQLFEQLAKKPNYFGFASADRVSKPYALCPAPRDPDPVVLNALTARPAMQRALELHALGEWRDARSEWNVATRNLNREQRRQAAVLADGSGWFGRAILTLADTGHTDRYDLRFPLAWHAEVTQNAARFGLNASLIYGVMRSESALVVDAVSGAGARGLMQLTPQTGREIASSLGESNPGRRGLLREDVNLRLGSAYLASLFERYNHPLKVLAAYNAGPDAVARWESLDLPEEPDRWIESLPYYETRDYLMRVLAFTTLYDWRREGKMVPLAQRMPALDLRPGVTDYGIRGRVVPRCPS
ncbi:MAG: transglycosylase SLT domain-containing protein [Pseudomonadota bacterium]